MHRFLLILFGIIYILDISAQESSQISEQWIADVFEQYVGESEDEIDFTSFYEELMAVAQEPININNASREQLQHLVFLSDLQIENILAYLYKQGRLETLYELQLIDGIDQTDIRRMLPFVRLGERGEVQDQLYWADFWRYGKSEIMYRLDRTLETKAGNQALAKDELAQSISNSQHYVGSPFYNSFKFRFHLRDRVQFGYTGEKDAGESVWSESGKGYGFNSMHCQLNDFGSFKTIVLGDYRASFGQGLVLQGGMSQGKSSNVLNVLPRNEGLKKYSSTDEYNFFRGGGMTIRVGKFDFSAFASSKKMDADTLQGIFQSITKTGYQRTVNEIVKNNTVKVLTIGGNANLRLGLASLGFTMVHTRFSQAFMPEEKPYNRFYFRGREQSTAGINYRWRLQKLNLYGETAYSSNNGIATINGVLFSPVSSINLVALHRYYSHGFDNLFAGSFSESSRINNESGVYIGTEIRPFAKWKFSAYADSYRFPWLKYGVDAPSLGMDYLMQADYTINRTKSMYWRIKFEEKEANSAATQTLPCLVPVRKSSARYQFVYSLGHFRFKNVIESSFFKTSVDTWKFGFLALQDLCFDAPSFPLKVDLRFQFFDIPYYDNRIYVYESDVLYAFSVPMFYGVGSRYYLNLQYEITDALSLYFKLSQTIYADEREFISSGNELINGNRKTDFRFLIKCNF